MRLLALLFFCYELSFAAGEMYNRGEMLFLSYGCTGCHGPSGEGSSQYPRLANRGESMLANQLRYYRKGKVSSQSAEIMVQFTLSLSDANIDDLAYFLSHHKKSTQEGVSSELLGGFGS